MKKFKLNKILVVSTLLVVAGLLVAQQGKTLLKTELDDKETSLDSDSDIDDGPFPLLGFLVESNDKSGVPQYDFNQAAYEGCRAEVEGVADLTPSSKVDYKKNSCVVNDKNLYTIERLKVTGCQWTPQDSRNFQFDFLQQLKKEIVFEKIRILFRNDELICEGELLLPSGEKLPVSGNCAVADTSQFSQVNGKKPDLGSYPIYVAFDLLANSTPIGKIIKKTKGVGTEAHLLVSLSVPLKLIGSDYLSYMLTNEAVDACESQTSKK